MSGAGENYLNYVMLANPALNPFGWVNHAINPTNTEVTKLDGPIINYVMKDRENVGDTCVSSTSTKIPSGLSREERIAYIQAHGGPGLKMDKKPSKAESYLNYVILSNPMYNPFGWVNHAINPTNTEVTKLDGPIVKYLVDRTKG